jgi:hypothetical protein
MGRLGKNASIKKVDIALNVGGVNRFSKVARRCRNRNRVFLFYGVKNVVYKVHLAAAIGARTSIRVDSVLNG